MRLAIVLVVLAGAPAAPAQTGRDIVNESIHRASPETSFQIVRMTLTGVNDERERVFHMYQRKSKDGYDTRIEFKEPADVAGTVLLIVEGEGQYLWLPRIKRVRRVAGKSRSGAFMGSDFAFEDLETRSVEGADYELAGEARVGDTPCDRVTATPKKDVATSYSRIETCFSKTDRIPLEMRFYDADKKELKVLTVDVDSIRADGEFRIPHKMTMQTTAGHATRLEIEKLDLSPELTDSLFDPRSLDR